MVGVFTVTSWYRIMLSLTFVVFSYFLLIMVNVFSHALLQNPVVSHTCAVFIYILLIMVSVFTVMPWYTSLLPLCACDCLLFCTDANPEWLGITSPFITKQN